jgi:hypothetical protein
MFIEETPIKVVVYYRKNGRTFFAFTEEEFKNAKLKKETRDKYEKVEVEMKPLTWEIYNQLQEEASIENPATGQNEFSYKKYKENKLLKLLLKWSAKTKGKDGETIDVPITQENILRLSPDIAESIIKGYDTKSVMTEEEEKKS